MGPVLLSNRLLPADGYMKEIKENYHFFHLDFLLLDDVLINVGENGQLQHLAALFVLRVIF